MNNLGSVVKELVIEELKKRVIVVVDLSKLKDKDDFYCLWAGKNKFKGLRHFLNKYYNTIKMIYSKAEGDTVNIAIPFRYIIINTVNNFKNNRVVENIRNIYIKEIGGKLENNLEIQYNALPENTLSDEKAMKIYFGFGIFVPPSGKKPIIHFEIKGCKNDNWVEPKILTNKNNKIPAAFYSGQMGLSFSCSIDYSPAFIETPGILDDDYIFFFGRLSESGMPLFFALHIDEIEKDDNNNKGSNFSTGDTTIFPEGKIITVYYKGEENFQFRWRNSAQQNILQKQKPIKGAYLILKSLLLPRCYPKWYLNNKVLKCWINFTQGGNLDIYPMSGKVLSLVISSNDYIKVYDHSENKNIVKYYIKPNSSEFQSINIGGDEYDNFKIRPFFYKSKKILNYEIKYQLSPTDKNDKNDKVFGYILLPNIESGEKEIKEALKTNTFDLSWLNSCAYIQESGWSKKNTYGLINYFLFPNGGEKTILKLERKKNGKKLWVKNKNGNIAKLIGNNGIKEFPEKDSMFFLSGDEIIIGCYHFKFEKGS